MFAPRRVGFALIGAVVFILYGLWFTSKGDPLGPPAPIDSKQTFSTEPIPDQQFSPNITDALPLEEWEIEGHDDLSPLCRQTEWTEGLWLHCHSYCGPNKTSVCGGLNNARNRIQTCLRLAIDAGAGLILPSATERDEGHLVETNGAGRVCPEVYWNIDYLQTSLREQCPQLKLRMCDDRSGIKHVVEMPERHYLHAAHSNGTFRQFVQETFDQGPLNLTDVSAKNPAVVNFGDSFIGWDYKKSGELMTLRKALFKVIKFNQSLLDMSAKIGHHPKLNDGKYIGVHLRGEDDWPDGFGTAADQIRFYTAEIQRIQKSVSYNITTVYVSCGDEGAIQRFRNILKPLGFTVESKSTLLASSNGTLAQVESLPFDQKAIVEYQTLVDARFWMGLIMSSMSSLIAYARSIDNEEDFFSAYVFPGSTRNGAERAYPAVPDMRGNGNTKLMVVNGVDIMDSFP
ncbi:hypothetical protein ONS95_006543 [Cadophora gregata]|uniref:uncharacterized protein n=1 Tax=Cadophora gregata TaxID=51156 RepID=UPI0026DACC59|nr:uncharacterized protein ONS95_006543 [Cadophora gregata]KAK0101368.1 hypothetical protein ONS95_006543 [Cadophora gregata]KAK0106622.1 hypothetical protein ONS96_004243 [Cadophora gregata f. sp. sojae]